MRYSALICSRQPMLPTGQAGWVKATARAVKELSQNPDASLLCSLGTPQYDLTLALAADTTLPVKVALTSIEERAIHYRHESLKSHLCREYSLDPDRLTVELTIPNVTPDCDLNHLRDDLILDEAHTLYPLSIRPGGFFDRKLKSREYRWKINRRFEIPYRHGKTRLTQNYKYRTLCDKTARALDGHIVHWTRTAVRPNIALSAGEFYRAIASSGPDYIHSAENILRRILANNILRGSRRHQPDHQPMVAFSSAPLADALKLMRYRCRYREMSFEPFGVALPLKTAKHVGARPVSYVSDRDYKQLSPSERLFAHRKGKEFADWPAEREWRATGDVNLSEIMTETIALTETASQAKKISAEFNVTALPVFAD